MASIVLLKINAKTPIFELELAKLLLASQVPAVEVHAPRVGTLHSLSSAGQTLSTDVQV